MGIHNFLNKKAILYTFQKSFDNFRTASSPIQIQVGRKIAADLNELSRMEIAKLNAAVPTLVERYKRLRNLALENGAMNDLDPDYAYAALMESIVVSMGDEKISSKIMYDLMGWLSFIGVIQREK